MRILVSVLSLSMGGTAINAIEIGSLLRQRGHDVLVYGSDGPLRELIDGHGLEYLPAGPARRCPPSLAAMRSLTAIAADRGIDVIHAYDWAPTVEAAYGPHLRLGTPVLTTEYGMKVPRFVPRHLPMIVGYTGELEREQRRGRAQVHAVVCPVDVHANAPGGDRGQARQRFGFADGDLAAVIVSRLSADLKREGLLAAVRAVALTDPALALRLVIVGDGPCRAEIQEAAGQVNAELGRTAVSLAGQLLDPRPAYDAADIVLGMGTSAQKAMAFGKPVVIQGERGYWELLTPASMPKYLRQNFYGLGDGSDGAPRLAAILAGLARDRGRWPELGEFGRRSAREVFSNEAAADAVAAICTGLVARGRPGAARRAAGVARTSGWYAGFRAARAGRLAP